MSRAPAFIAVCLLVAALCGCARAQRFYGDETISSDVSIDMSYDVYYVDASGGSVTVSFADITNLGGTRWYFKRTDGNVLNTVTLAAYSGQTIEGASTLVLPPNAGVILHVESSTLHIRIMADYGL